MMKRFSISVFVAIVLITPLTLFALVKWMEDRWSSLPVYEGPNYTVRNFELQNQYGKNTQLDDWNGKIVVANFFFTHCPVVCPKMTKNLKKVQASVKDKDGILITSFSVDPERDSVRQLQSFARKFNISGNWHLLTGSKMDIYRLARKSFSLVATDGDGGKNDFIHSESLVLVDHKSRIRGYYKGTSDAEVQQLINDIQKLKHEN